jgi:UDP-N-acetylmuramate dehydrogenase
VSLTPFTALRVGGPADFFVLAQSGREIADALRWARDRGLPARVIGGGSNLLVSEAGIEGLVIKTGNTRHDVEERRGAPVLIAEAGANFANLARRLAKQGYGGLEWAANVPGTAGGAVVNNAGAFGGDVASCLISATIVDADGRTMRLRADELGYAYRTSVLKRRELGEVAVASVEVGLHASTPTAADGLVKQFNAERMRSQPRISSAGSVFANPAGSYSGKLIEEAALKGTSLGGAQISEQHANFIVNLGDASAYDIYLLMRKTQEVVFGQTGIWLRPEIELIGRWSPEEHAALDSFPPSSRQVQDERGAIARG